MYKQEMERERLLIARFIREHPQFRYTITYDEYCNMYILYYKTEVAASSVGIPSGISQEVLLKKINNGSDVGCRMGVAGNRGNKRRLDIDGGVAMQVEMVVGIGESVKINMLVGIMIREESNQWSGNQNWCTIKKRHGILSV